MSHGSWYRLYLWLTARRHPPQFAVRFVRGRLDRQWRRA